MNDKTTLPVDNFKWTDELVCEYHNWKMTTGAAIYQDPIKEFKKIKQPDTKEKEIRIKVGKFYCNEGEPGYGDMKWNIQFKTNKHIHYDKSVELCNLLERYLNGEMNNPAPSNQQGISLLEYLIRTGRLKEAIEYKSELEEAESKARKETWEAAREYAPKHPNDYSPSTYRYPSLSDYLSSIPEKSLNTINKEEKTKEQRDWEILEFRCEMYDIMLKKNIDGTFGTFNAEEKDLLTSSLHKIHSVKRLSDGEVFTVGDEVFHYCYPDDIVTISRFEIYEDKMRIYHPIDKKHDNEFYSFIANISPLKDKEQVVTDNSDVVGLKIDEDAFKNRCNVCGSDLVYIRGKYPNTDKRPTCPTCTTERLEQISEISNKDYGKVYQNKN